MTGLQGTIVSRREIHSLVDIRVPRNRTSLDEVWTWMKLLWKSVGLLALMQLYIRHHGLLMLKMGDICDDVGCWMMRLLLCAVG